MNDLLQKLESYNWTDELGHPLVNCQDWIDLKEWINNVSNLKVQVCDPTKPSKKLGKIPL